ncbi:gamma-butyrobetaine hydroxylase-like domain-containing protein [Zavarzinia compransoris]|uniref:Gamma-butyrobetaine hydroxylase-like N-terminal domain-containing protein n=1 Tax=Zavarzinia compransoris TaxID=1264899 RepID=A0A317E2H6_9PROT|nr:DUF971 domain-containing protein [Zavarzinia compransoris]PWR20792.1 hypothetical protein DKG75_12430 [Zavarzinia compransoris]TDP44373.1 DUF971 family protein [Zavarzinia compransoris]
MTGAAGGGEPWPLEIRIRRAERALEVDWDDGRKDRIPAELLRVESPSAEVQGHGPATKRLVAGKRHVAVVGAEPVGHYAVRLIFDDGHDSGLYTWATLRRFGEDQAQMFVAYLEALSAKGLMR